MTSGHSERAHALLGASSAKQWLNCTPSIRAGEHKKSETSSFALEGTVAHELSELFFSHMYEGMTARTFNKRLKEKKQEDFYKPEMDDYIQDYVSFVEERVNAAIARDKEAAEESLLLLFETALDLSTYVPESFGTGDVIIYSQGTLDIIDLKYGKREVSALDNPQLRLYGLGAIELISPFEDVLTVNMTIVQPRLNNISVETLSAAELETWGREYVAPRAAKAFKGEGEYVPGDHCIFCKIKGACRARAEFSKQKALPKREPYLLSSEELSDLLYVVDDIAKWAKDVKSYALNLALEGNPPEGFKLVAGKRSRNITDTQEALSILSLSYDTDAITKPAELKSIAQLEKTIGKKTAEDLIGHLVHTSEGAPTLVEESDKRPALGDLSSLFDELKN